MKFSDLRLSEPILRAIGSEGYETATPIQAQAIPHILQGKDLLGCAQTGTGKTAAFALPILHRLTQNAAQVRGARCLVLAPTRELATQIADSFRVYGKNLHLKSAIIFGGVNQRPQVDTLRRGVDVIIATPGRLLDLMNQRFVDLRAIEVLVLDEADRMLDMGFIHDIRKIVAQVPQKRQTLLFSATMPSEIRQLANSLLHSPVNIQVAPPATVVEAIDESVYFVEKRNKPQLLAHLYNELSMFRTIVFTRTKHGADRVVRQLHTRGIKAEAIHGNKSQNARERALNNFRSSKTPVLVATDIASRGIDIDGITHVVNYDLTHEPDTYVHRIGRTARAGASGAAISFCDHDERPNLRAIESLVRRAIPVKNNHPQYVTAPAEQKQQGHSHVHQPHRREQHPQSHQHSHPQQRREQPSQQQKREAHSRAAWDAMPHGSRRPAPGHASPVAAKRPAHRQPAAHPLARRGGGGNRRRGF